MKKIILVCFLFLNSCYMSYEAVSDEGEVVSDEGEVVSDEGEVVSDEGEVVSDEGKDEVVNDEGEVVGDEDEVDWIKNSIIDLSQNRVIRELGRLRSKNTSESMEPILYFIEPETGCINKDSWFTIYGSRIHWYSAVNMRYPYSGKVENFREVNWYDNSQIDFKIERSMDLVSGNYLVKTTDSNEIGFYLEYCK